MEIETTLTKKEQNKIVSADGSVGGSQPVGILTGLLPRENIGSVTTYGECRVSCATQLAAGDWFASDDDGLAVKVTAGFALGRILEATVDGVSLAVIGAVNL